MFKKNVYSKQWTSLFLTVFYFHVFYQIAFYFSEKKIVNSLQIGMTFY